MKEFHLLLLFIGILAIRASAQEVPPPCGEKGIPDNVPCMDLKTGKVLHTKMPLFTPHRDLPPLPPIAKPSTIPKIQPVAPGTVKTIPTTLPDSNTYTKPHPDATAPQEEVRLSAKDNEGWDRIAKEKEQEFESGEALGATLGSAIGNALNIRRVKHDINKACFDKGAKGWLFPNGHTAKCSDWEIIHPRQEHGVPPDITPEFAMTISQICRNKHGFIYMTRSYSCNDWRKYEKAVAARKNGAESTKHKATKGGGTNILLMMLENDRLDLTARPDDKQAMSSWLQTKEAYCQSSPDSFYRELNGKIGYCGGMARQAYNMMEELRKSIVDLQSSSDGFAKSTVQESESSWHEMKEIYCQDVPNGKYTTLGGKVQSCTGGR